MRRLARHLFTLCSTGVAGAVAVAGAAMAYLVIEDTLLPLDPAYSMPADSFRQARWLLRDRGTLTALASGGAACGLLAPFAARAAMRHLMRKRFESGRCPACGYDLRASPERCPECGAAAGRENA